ncbi:hypothetical protein EJ110_NYTH26216 [Nymphaea thermarum]|nr:hypothetical protein EJ110_NYTH26216 [Nymphaea thermarum]
MPDMHGFKLLELIGLQMDLPVISIRKKVGPKGRRKKGSDDDCNKFSHGIDGAQGHSAAGQAHINCKLAKKRGDRNNAEGDDEEEENGNENEDQITQKKTNIVSALGKLAFTIHLKRSTFIMQISIFICLFLVETETTPKSILDIMNVNKPTRENDASDLQERYLLAKYRLYLKRINNAANQQANMTPPLGVENLRDSSSVSTSSTVTFRDFHFLDPTVRIYSTRLSFFQEETTTSALGNLNSDRNLSTSTPSSTKFVQMGSYEQLEISL